MGEAKSATQRLIEQYPSCCYCGGLRASATREHMPPRSLFDNSHRPDKLVMPACIECNKGTSTADLTVAMASRWAYDNSLQEQADHRMLARRVKRQAPELVEEWTTSDPVQRAKARLRLVDQGMDVPEDAGLLSIGPLTIRQLNLFAHKAVLALYFEHVRQPVPNTGRVYATWRTKEDFSKEGIPRILLDMLPNHGTLTQGKWDERKTFEYRHDTNAAEGLFGCFVKLRRSLFISGFAVADASVLPVDEPSADWVIPSQLLALLDSPRFRKKL
jgi:hypothetical protein